MLVVACTTGQPCFPRPSPYLHRISQLHFTYKITHVHLELMLGDHVVAYASCVFTQAEHDYSIIECGACGTCQIEAIWLLHAANLSFVFLLVSPVGFVGSEQD